MADLSGIMGQLNALRGAYGGSQMTPSAMSGPAPLNLGRPAPMSGNPMAYLSQMGGNNSPARTMPAPQIPVPASGPLSFYDPASYNPVPRSLPQNAGFTSSLTGTTADPARMNARLGMLPQGVDLANQSIFGSLTPAMGWKPTVGDIAKAWGATGTDPTQQFLNQMPALSAGKQQRFAEGGWDKMGEQIISQMLQQAQAAQRAAQQTNRR